LNPKSIDEFQSCCRARRCLRATIITPRCKLESKQTACYAKYIKKLDRDKGKKRKPIRVKRDTDYEDFVREVWLLETGDVPKKFIGDEWKPYCCIWGAMTTKEKSYVNENFYDTLWLNKDVDVAHLEGKGSNPEDEKRLSPSNAALCGRGFHSLLDTYKDPVTHGDMTREQRDIWIERIRNCSLRKRKVING